MKLGISFSIAIALTSLVLVGVLLVQSSSKDKPDNQIAEELTSLRNTVKEFDGTVKQLRERIAILEEQNAARLDMAPAHPSEMPSTPAKEPQEPEEGVEPPPAEEVASSTPSNSAPPEILEPYADQMKDYVFGLIQEERDFRKQMARERAKRMREKRKELSKGPYENFNLKINSMAEALDLDQNQTDLYYEASKFYWDKLEEVRKNLDWRDRKSRQEYTKAREKLQEDFNSEVENLLTSEQLETYKELPSYSKRIRHRGYVAPPGERQKGFSVNSLRGRVIEHFNVRSQGG